MEVSSQPPQWCRLVRLNTFLSICQVACKKTEMCITGVWAVYGGKNVALRAPLAANSNGVPIAEINGAGVLAEGNHVIASYRYLEFYSPGRVLMHYKGRSVELNVL